MNSSSPACARGERLRALELGDVEQVPLDAEGLAFRVVHDHALVAQPDCAAVGAHDAVLDLQAHAGLEHAGGLARRRARGRRDAGCSGRSPGWTPSPPACSRGPPTSAGSRRGSASPTRARRCRRSGAGPRRVRGSCRTRAAADPRGALRPRRHARVRRGSSYIACIGSFRARLEPGHARARAAAER